MYTAGIMNLALKYKGSKKTLFLLYHKLQYKLTYTIFIKIEVCVHIVFK